MGGYRTAASFRCSNSNSTGDDDVKCVLLHGLGQSAASWNDTVKHMEQKADILCPELSQWLEGRKPHYNSLYHGLEQYCAQVDAPLNLCGLSLGGILALQYGIEHPEQVNSLVLIGAQYTMPRGLLRFQNALFRLMPKRAFQEMGFKKMDFIELCKSMFDLNFQVGLRQIGCPVLIVCGEKDGANKAAALQMNEQIPNAKLLMIPGSGHEVNRDAPDELGKALQGFFEGNV